MFLCHFHIQSDYRDVIKWFHHPRVGRKTRQGCIIYWLQKHDWQWATRYRQIRHFCKAQGSQVISNSYGITNLFSDLSKVISLKMAAIRLWKLLGILKLENYYYFLSPVIRMVTLPLLKSQTQRKQDTANNTVISAEPHAKGKS